MPNHQLTKCPIGLTVVLIAFAGSGCSTTLFNADFRDWPYNTPAGGPPGDPAGDSVGLVSQGGGNTLVGAFGIGFSAGPDDGNDRTYFYSTHYDQNADRLRIQWHAQASPDGAAFACNISGGDIGDTNRTSAVRIRVQNNNVYCSRPGATQLKLGELTTGLGSDGYHNITVFYDLSSNSYTARFGQPGISSYETCTEGVFPGGAAHLNEGPRVIVDCGYDPNVSSSGYHFIRKTTIKEK